MPALQDQLQTLLRKPIDRGGLLREIGAMAQEPEFAGLAAVWAPALFERDPQFFESFLVRHLDGTRHPLVIRELLRRAEAAGHDSLFAALYAKVARPDEWNAEIRRLAAATASDDDLLRAVQRRLFRGIWFGFDEEVALLLYRRNPRLFGPIIAQACDGRQETICISLGDPVDMLFDIRKQDAAVAIKHVDQHIGIHLPVGVRVTLDQLRDDPIGRRLLLQQLSKLRRPFLGARERAE